MNAAIQAAVKEKRLCLLSGRASLLAEDVPADLLVDDATLQLPPAPLVARDVIPDNLPEAWKGNVETTALEIADALSTKAGKALPWIIVRDALTAAFNARFVERAYGQWPCDYAGAGMVRVSQRKDQVPPSPKPEPRPEEPGRLHEPGPKYAPVPGVLATEAKLNVSQIQDLNDQLSALTKACVDAFGMEPVFSLRIEVHPKALPKAGDIERVNGILGEVAEELKLI